MTHRFPATSLHFARIVGAVAALSGLGGVPAALHAQSVNPPRPPRPSHHINVRDDVDGVAHIDTLVPLASDGTVDLSLIAGSIRVSTWNRNQARVVANATDDATIEFDASGSHLELSENRRRGDGHGTVTYDVTVPAGVRASLTTVSGTIDVSGVRGGLETDAVSGNVTVRDVAGAIEVDGVSSGVSITNASGDVHAETVSGRMALTNISGPVTVETVSGGITLTGIRSQRVHSTTVSGSLEFAGAIDPAGRYDFESHSGRVALTLGGNASATLRVETFSGSVTNEYPGAVRRPASDGDGDEGRTYTYLLGRGDARVRVETFSGRVTISQGNQ